MMGRELELLGEVVEVFGDPLFKAVITSVEYRLGGEPRFCLEYRDGRGIVEKWVTKAQLDAYAKLKEN